MSPRRARPEDLDQDNSEEECEADGGNMNLKEENAGQSPSQSESFRPTPILGISGKVCLPRSSQAMRSKRKLSCNVEALPLKLRHCGFVLMKIINHPRACIFLTDKHYAKQYEGNSAELISLCEIEEKLFNETYEDENEFIRDVRDLFKNCEKYNENGSQNFNYAIELKNVFEFELQKKSIKQLKNKTSQYSGVDWNRNSRKWQARLVYNKKQYYGRLCENEEQAAMSVNLLCDKFEIERINPTINIKLYAISKKSQNKTSQYLGVSWNSKKRKWVVQLNHNKKQYYGGLFENEKAAAMNVNLLCDKFEIERKNPTIIHITSDEISKQSQNKTSQYFGVYWNKDARKWTAQLWHKKKQYYGGLFENEKEAAMNVNLLCDKFEIERKNPTINIKVDAIPKQFRNKSSQYWGVSWNKDARKWKAQLNHNKKQYYGGLFENEEQAAMKSNLLCDKMEIERKNPTINIKLDEIHQQFRNKTSQYSGVSWHKITRKWQARLDHNKKQYYDGSFENEEQAAMRVNLLCDKFEIERKNPTIDIKLDEIQKKFKNTTSQYLGVCWNSNARKWQAQLNHNKKQYYGGLFENEKQAAICVNILCDKF